MKRIVNGRAVEIPEHERNLANVEEVRKSADIPSDRALVLQRADGSSQLLPSTDYSFYLDPNDQILELPTSTRGFAAPRAILARHIKQLSYACTIDLADDLSYVVIKGVLLPPGYNYARIPVLVEIPSDYPLSPPGIGDSRIYMPSDIQFRGKKLRDFNPTINFRKDKRWGWFCYQEINWDPSVDNLIKLLEMIRADLHNPETGPGPVPLLPTIATMQPTISEILRGILK